VSVLLELVLMSIAVWRVVLVLVEGLPHVAWRSGTCQK
jgi:uncharacterized membrane protein